MVDANPILRKFVSIVFHSRRDLVFMNLFWIGVILYTVCFATMSTKSVPFSLFQLIQLGAIGLMLLSATQLIGYDFENRYLKMLLPLFLLWAMVILLRGFELEFTKERRNAFLFNAWFGAAIYLVPWIALFPKKLIFYRKLFISILLSSIVYVFLCFAFLSVLMVEGKDVASQAVIEYFSKTLAVSSFFILFTEKFHSRRVVYFSLFVILLTLFFGVIRARRGILFFIVLGFLLWFSIYFIKSNNKFAIILQSFSFLAFVVFILIGVRYVLDIEVFSFLEERGTEDTRYLVEMYFFKDMKELDWIVGRGMFGMYYAPTQDFEAGAYRGTIETDYLNMVLKGGLINLVLLLIIILPAVYFGLLRSKNTLALGFAMWIVFWMLNTYPSTVQVFSLNYLLVWVGVGFCYSPTLRNIPDRFLVNYFRGQNRLSKLKRI